MNIAVPSFGCRCDDKEIFNLFSCVQRNANLLVKCTFRLLASIKKPQRDCEASSLALMGDNSLLCFNGPESLLKSLFLRLPYNAYDTPTHSAHSRL